MNHKFGILLAATLFITSCGTLSQLALTPSNLENIAAIKKILNSSTFKALKSLKALNSDGLDGLLPKEVNTVLNTMKTLGYGDEINNVKNAISNASGIALQESEGIMADAISELKITDAVAVILGGKDAATSVLKNAMVGAVKKRYSARLEQELAKTDALQYWPLAAGAYNMFAKDKIEGSLSDFLAERAVDGLFLALGKEEANIRTDYKSLGDAVVTKVFDYYKDKKQNP